MKRDMDLVRIILLAVETAPEGSTIANTAITPPGYSAEAVSEHILLLHGAGFIEASISKTLGSLTPRHAHIYRLTWRGHEFLDSVRDPQLWSKTKQTVLSKGASLTFEIVTAVATSIMKQSLGLPPG